LLSQENMAINPASLLPSNIMERAASSQHVQPVIADLNEPAHVKPLHTVSKVLCL